MKKLKKFSLIVIILFSCFLVLAVCKHKNPVITNEITICNISNEEYAQIDEVSKPEGITVNDLKKLYVEVVMSNSKEATERAIIIPDLYIIDKFDRVRTTGGYNSYSNNIGMEDTAESIAYIIFDNRGLSEKDIIKIYKNSEIIISYKLPNLEVEEKLILGNNIKFRH